MHATKQTSSSLKVGVLTLAAIIILIFTVLWIKGRSLSGGERIEINFKDVNGIRAGSGVQMMGLRIGQIEEITPVIDGKSSYVKVRFVITEGEIQIPPFSTISIQQSGLIGEQFLEITPPKTKTLYIETSKSETSLQKGDKIFMHFNGNLKEIAVLQDSDVVLTQDLPIDIKSKIDTKNALKIDYMINVAGLILNNDDLAAKIENGNLVFSLRTGVTPEFPTQRQPYTVIEPMRISDFMDMQFRSARAFTEMNEKVSQTLSNEMINDITQSVANLNNLSGKALTTMDKAQALVENSKDDIELVLNQSGILVTKLIGLTDNVSGVLGDKDFKNTVVSVGRLSNNINGILEDKQSKEMLANIDEITKNLAEITTYVNDFTKDEKLKKDLKQTVSGINSVTKNLNATLACLNELEEGERINLKNAIADAVITTRNLKTFSQKLNKRFALFRIMF